ncbi:MAG TPA: choice-of-anchor D domain-containing protein [Candidatus Kapabacteria bacterium]|nr:choice-of-anchor D domain-containing protein [Candidatus Kapabacteria bacterium]
MKTLRCLLLAIVGIAGAAQLRAGGPLSASGTTARRYATGSFPLTYRVDQGTLGAFSNTTATNIVGWSFWEWDSIGSAALSFNRGTQLPRDVNTGNDAYITGTGQWSDGINPIVFDTDGTITDAKLGAGAKNSVLGFATSAWTGTTYVEGYAIINGYLSGSGSTTDEDRYKATIVHEIGHFLGLAHSQVTMHADYSTMYPIIHKTAQRNTTPDDTAAMASLYPATGFTASVGAISGTVRTAAGSDLGGVVVLAVDSATGAAYSSVVDYYSGGSTAFASPPAASGSYTISGLPPGRYYVRIEPPKPEFSGGSLLASYATPQNTGIAREWYNGIGESGDMLLDDQNQKTSVGVSAGSTTGGIDIVANASATTSTLSYHASTSASSYGLPQGSNTGYAVRFTAPSNGSLVGVAVRVSALSVLPLTGTLTVTVHASAPGSLAGIPGTALGSVTIPYRDISANQETEIWLRGLGTAINFTAGTDFHVALTTNGSGTFTVLTDNGASTQNRSSYYTSANGWRNIPQGMAAGTPGYNLQMSAIYSTTLAGNPTPAITLGSTSLDFGRVRVNASADRTITVSNPGTATLNVSAAAATGADASAFTVIAGGAPFTVAPNASHQMTVRFTARRGGSSTKTASLSITSDAPTSPSAVSLTGTAIEPVAAKLMASIALGSRRVDSAHAITFAVLRNTGNDTLAISSIALAGADAGAGIRLLSSGAATRLAPDSTLAVRLEFAPTVRRSYAATLTVSHDDSTGSTSFAIAGTGVAPLIAASRDSLDLGGVRVQASGTAELWLRNTGNATMSLDGFSFVGADSTAFTIVAPSSLPQIVAQGDSILVRARFAPTGRRGYSTVLRVRTNAIPATKDIVVAGRGLAPVAYVPALAVVGSATVGSSIQEPALAVRNIGDAPLTIASLAIGGAHASEFSVAGVTLPAVVAPGDSVVVRIRFAPTVAGARTAELIVTSDDPASATQLVTLAASGLQGRLQLISGDRVDFGDVTIATTGQQSLRVTNSGAAPLVVADVALSGAGVFTLTVPGLPLTIAPGDTVVIPARFAPVAAGAVSARITFVSNGVMPSTELELVGRGVAPGLALDRSALAFGAVPIAQARLDSFVVRNTGALPLTGVTLTLDGPAASAFAIVSPSGAFDVAAGATRVVVVRLLAQSEASALSAGIRITATGGARSDVSISATIVESMLATVSDVDFGTRADNAPIDTVIVVRNSGTIPLRIDSIAVEGAKEGVRGAFFLATATAATLEPGGSLDVRVRFAPYAGAGAYTGRVVIYTNNPPDSAVSIALAGVVSAPSNVDDPVTGTGALQVSAVRPNPASTNAWLTIRTAQPTHVVVAILDARGHVIATAFDGETVGEDHILIDASVLSAGEYIVSVRSGENVATRRLIVVR